MRKLQMPHIQISYAARCLYARGGPKAFTMRALGKAVGVSASALYRHFKNHRRGGKTGIGHSSAAVAAAQPAEGSRRELGQRMLGGLRAA